MTHEAEFRPHGLLSTAFVQTVIGAAPVWIPRPLSTLVRVPIEGGFLHLHTTLRPHRAPGVVLVHGIGGSSDSNYVLRASSLLLDAGFHVGRLDLRGAGSSLVDAPSLYHAGLDDDLTRAGRAMAEQPGVDGVAFVGFSLGGNLVLKMAGEWGASPPPFARAVIAMSPLVDLEPTSAALETRATFFYRTYVIRSLRATALAFAARQRAKGKTVAFHPERTSALSTVRDYDREVIVPMHGFRDVAHYYEVASSGPLLGAITVPTLFAFAEDDPMIPVSTVRPWLERAGAAPIDVVWSKQGGHVGWFEGLTREAFVRTWGMRLALDFLRKQTS